MVMLRASAAEIEALSPQVSPIATRGLSPHPTSRSVRWFLLCALLAAETGSEDGADLARLLAGLPSGGIGVNFDPGNLIINGFSPREALAALGRDVLHVHAKDAVRDLAQGRGLETPLGRGSADIFVKVYQGQINSRPSGRAYVKGGT